MKPFKNLFIFSLAVGGFFACPVSLRAQQNSVSASGAAFADETVGTVGRRKITRRDVVISYVNYNPKILGEAILERNAGLSGVVTLDMDALCRRVFAAPTPGLENVMERLLILNALQEAAEQRNITVPKADLAARIHSNLEVRRRAMNLPEAPDAEMALKLDSTIELERETAQESLLKERLTLADLDDRLGHPLNDADYYSLHAIFTRVTDAQSVFNPKATLEKIRAQRNDILAKKRTFEEIAAKESQDVSGKRNGAFGATPRKLLKNEIDAALEKLQPGEITEPIAILEGYAIFRLDKRGKDLTPQERKNALATYLNSEKRSQDAVGKALKNIPWTTTLGKTPEWIKLTEEADKL